jgi:SAM-dependent methyltransferase
VNDPKQGERDYFARIGEAGRLHAARKPFSDACCVQNLANLTSIMALMRPPPARVVEFGCGTGWLSLFLAERGYEVTGVDISPDAIAIARQLQAGRQLRSADFSVADYEEINLEPNADYVVFHDALHHAESETAALRAAHAALKSGGLMICIEPGEGHSDSPSSRRAVNEFAVHEKDMPPRVILRHARAAGFRRHLVLPFPWEYTRTMYRPGYSNATSGADAFARKWLSLMRSIRSFFTTRAQGTVLLWKD